MNKFMTKYVKSRKRKAAIAWDKAKRMRVCYLFLLPHAVLFLTFYILPMFSSIFFSFTFPVHPGLRPLPGQEPGRRRKKY